MLNNVFQEFGLSDSDAKLYLRLLEGGACTVGRLAHHVPIARTTLYGQLEKLKALGFVLENPTQGSTKTYSAEAPERLLAFYKQKLERMHILEKQFEKIIPDLESLNRSESKRPRLQYFDGRAAEHYLSDILTYQDMTVYSFWPIKSMVALIGTDYLVYWNMVRIRRNIRLRAIWPQPQTTEVRLYPFMGLGEPFLREARLAPQEIKSRLSYIIYEDKVIFTSSDKEKFGFTLQSTEMSEMMREQFMLIWSLSKPLPPSGKEGKPFLDELKTFTEDTSLD